MVAVDAGGSNGQCNGVMLMLSCKDSNNMFIYVATAETPKEEAPSYRVCFQQAKRNPEKATFLNGRDTTFFFDGHMGWPAAIKAKAPLLSTGRASSKY